MFDRSAKRRIFSAMRRAVAVAEMRVLVVRHPPAARRLRVGRRRLVEQRRQRLVVLLRLLVGRRLAGILPPAGNHLQVAATEAADSIAAAIARR